MSDRPSERILSGPLGREVVRFGAPLALGMGLQTAFNLIDAFVISRLGGATAGPALGAIGICDQLAALGTIVSYGLSVATATLISRRVGEGNQEAVREIAWQSLLVIAALSLFFGIFGGFGANFVLRGLVGAKGEVARLGVPYLRVMLAGSFTIFLLMHLTSVQRALGSSKTPVGLLIASNVLNLVLAVVMVYGPGDSPAVLAWGRPLARLFGVPRMGLMGAAWATLIARFVVLVPLFAILMKRFGLFVPTSRAAAHRETIAAIVRLGWPSSAQLVVRIIAMLVTHSLVARAFTTPADQSATTALGIVFRLETMALFVGLGWGSAAQTFVGQNLGAQNVERAKLSGWYAAMCNAAMMGGLAIVYTIYGESIVGFFDSDPDVLRPALSYFKWVGASYVGLGIAIVLGSAIQGAGATLRALLLDTLVVAGFQLPTSVAFVLSKSATYVGLWQIVGLTYFLFALVYVISYRRGRFLNASPAATA
ncbi:MAG TPA: MATE family efflux transporter [Polyangiaceae bacterium]|nr:MATE family efflux transporter [Polyangiaceae bacterium]